MFKLCVSRVVKDSEVHFGRGMIREILLIQIMRNIYLTKSVTGLLLFLFFFFFNQTLFVFV